MLPPLVLSPPVLSSLSDILLERMDDQEIDDEDDFLCVGIQLGVV
jgi:hypothetical protein|tara:strand:+ start:414 stop:548 length:135 start_codon:yes stop_codon:yes gene_type:complete